MQSALNDRFVRKELSNFLDAYKKLEPRILARERAAIGECHSLDRQCEKYVTANLPAFTSFTAVYGVEAKVDVAAADLNYWRQVVQNRIDTLVGALQTIDGAAKSANPLISEDAQKAAWDAMKKDDGKTFKAETFAKKE